MDEKYFVAAESLDQFCGSGFVARKLITVENCASCIPDEAHECERAQVLLQCLGGIQPIIGDLLYLFVPGFRGNGQTIEVLIALAHLPVRQALERLGWHLPDRPDPVVRDVDYDDLLDRYFALEMVIEILELLDAGTEEL